MSWIKEWQLNALGIDSYHSQTESRLRFLYTHIRQNALDRDGDIYEFGVFRGASLIAMALILKELGSDKKVIGFDSFRGFPSYSEFDQIGKFSDRDYFDEQFISDLQEFIDFKRSVCEVDNLTAETLAESGNFSKTSFEEVQRKVEYFELENIEIIEGDFRDTVPTHFRERKPKILSCNIDCDLYEGYRTVLPHVYDSLTTGGYIHLDEYYSFKYPGAKIAVDDFCSSVGSEVMRQEARSTEFPRFYITK